MCVVYLSISKHCAFDSKHVLLSCHFICYSKATSALDTITENSIQEALLTLGRNRTVLVIAHRLSTVKHANQIVVMDAGRVVEVGSHEQLLSNPNSVYSHMWDMQSHSTAGVGSSGSVGSNNRDINSPVDVLDNKATNSDLIARK